MKHASINQFSPQIPSNVTYCKKSHSFFLDTISHREQKTVVVSPPPTPIHSVTDTALIAVDTVQNDSHAINRPSSFRQLNKRANTFVKTYAAMAPSLKSHTCQGTFTLNVYEEFNKAILRKIVLNAPFSRCRSRQRSKPQSMPKTSVLPPFNEPEFSAIHSEKRRKQFTPQRLAANVDFTAGAGRIKKKERAFMPAYQAGFDRKTDACAQQRSLTKDLAATTSLPTATSTTTKSTATTKLPKKKRVTISSILPIGKEAQAAFDALDIDSADDVFYPEGWVPSSRALDDQNGTIKLTWKGSPMNIEGQAYYDHLHVLEVMMASSLRLSPVQYLKCKRTLIIAAKKLKEQEVPFTKSIAQRLCRVDVNKTSALWTIFRQLGWFN